MLVLAQASCLMSGPQLIHLFRYGRHSLHRRIYSLNTLATSIEIFILMFFCRVPGRNLGLCPDLGLAMVEFSRNRLAFLQTLPSWLLAISLLLSLLDWFINWRDTHVNKGRRENNKHTIPFRPRKMTWELKANQTQRYIWGFLGTMLYAVTIFSIESRTIHAFEHFIAGKDGVSLTSEEQWNFGQMFAISIGITSAALLIRAGLLEILFPWAKKAACKKPCFICQLMFLAIRNGTYSCLDIELRRIECFSKIFFLLAPLTKVRGKGRKPTRGSSCRSQPLDHEETINTAGASPDMAPVPTLPHRLATTHPELTLSPPSKSQEISD